VTPGPTPRRSRATAAAAVACLALAACAGAGAPRGGDGLAAAADPATRFDALERALLDARTVAMDFHVTAEGAVEADVRGRLELGPDGAAVLRADGVFAGSPIDVMLHADAQRMRYGTAADPDTVPRPPHLREALVIGLTRMGILHNIARLTGGAAPDHADGGVAEWVTVGGFAEAVAGSAGTPPIAFDLTVAGRPAGSATLVIDAGSPVVRRQTVRFPQGEMRVVERYAGVVVTP
jgi:hypothetical protein